MESPFLSLVDGMELRSHDAGEEVIEQGALTGEMLVLISGAVEVLRDGVRVARSREPGVVFGEMSALLRQPATATVRAAEHCEFKVIPDPRGFLVGHPEASLFVAELLARRLNELNLYLVDVKRQYQGHDHLSMVDDVLDSLMHRPRRIQG